MTKTKVLFLGNCQISAVAHILNLDHNLFDVSVISIHLPSEQEVILRSIKDSDIIITQRIRSSYGYASTKEVLINKQEQAKIIIFNSCFMKFYYFDTQYLVVDKKLIERPTAYHHKSVIDNYKSSKTTQECINQYICNKDLMNENQLLFILNNDIEQLSIRYQDMINIINKDKNISIIDIKKFILENYNKQLLFYSFNHPTGILLKYIVDNIMNILNFSHNISDNLEVLGETRCILYSCLHKLLDFNILNHEPNINKLTNIDSIVQQYYLEYDNVFGNKTLDIY